MRAPAPRPSDKVRAYLRGLWGRSRRRAERDGIPFDLDPSDLEGYWRAQGGRCALSGRPLGIDTGRYAGRVDGRRINNVSVDRKDSGLGYTRGNCWLVACAVNIAKNVLAVETFVALCGSVAARSRDPADASGCGGPGRPILLEEDEDEEEREGGNEGGLGDGIGSAAVARRRPAEDFAAAIAQFAWRGTIRARRM